MMNVLKRHCGSSVRNCLYLICNSTILAVALWHEFNMLMCRFYCRAMLYISAAYAVMQCLCVCLCVCPSVTFVDRVKTNKCIFKNFLPLGSHTILVFRTKCHGTIPTGTPLKGASNVRGYEKNVYFWPISRFIYKMMQDTAIVTIEGE